MPFSGGNPGTGVEIDGDLIFIIEVNRLISGLIVVVIINLQVLLVMNI